MQEKMYGIIKDREMCVFMNKDILSRVLRRVFDPTCFYVIFKHV